MSHQAIPFRIDPMTLADIPEVVFIEKASYSMTWPEKVYDYELQRNDLAHYFVLRIVNQLGESQSPALPKMSHRAEAESIIGLGGFWLMSDEAHINTIAIHPNWRRRGLGEWMLITLLEAGQGLGAVVATLEVRPSNLAARSLYHKFDFQEMGRRPHYYSDNGEDALILTTSRLTLPDYQAMLHQRKTALGQRLAKIRVDTIRPIV